MERQSAKAESCIRNFLLQTVPLLSRFHRWRAASSRALKLGLRPQRRVAGPLTEPKKERGGGGKILGPRRGRARLGLGSVWHRCPARLARAARPEAQQEHPQLQRRLGAHPPGRWPPGAGGPRSAALTAAPAPAPRVAAV